MAKGQHHLSLSCPRPAHRHALHQKHVACAAGFMYYGCSRASSQHCWSSFSCFQAEFITHPSLQECHFHSVFYQMGLIFIVIQEERWQICSKTELMWYWGMILNPQRAVGTPEPCIDAWQPKTECLPHAPVPTCLQIVLYLTGGDPVQLTQHMCWKDKCRSRSDGS